MTFEEWFDKEGGYDGSFDTYESAAKAAWESRVPEGYVLVPVEPTEKMLSAVDGNDLMSWDSEAIYKAMILAAQEKE